jgi:GGDEF domain-containing protein
VCERIKRFLGRILGFEKELEDLRQRVRELSWDSAFGMWTRSAFLQFCRVMPRGQRAIAFLDLNDIHSLNHELGYVEVDRRVREAFAIPLRRSDIVARWYSGDEIVILFDSDLAGAEKKMEQLMESSQRHGLAFTSELGTWSVGQTDIVDAVNELSERNRKKGGETRGARHEAGSR